MKTWAAWALVGLGLEAAALHRRTPTFSRATRTLLGTVGRRRTVGNIALAAVLVWFWRHEFHFDAKGRS